MEKSLFEQVGGTYRRVGDYYIPNLSLEAEEQHPSAFGDSDTGGI